MTDHVFDQALISGYLDGELTQGDAQRVRLHLEDCADCRAVADELRQLKEATMTTEFRVPEDTQWDETPRNRLSWLFHLTGWIVAGAWVLGFATFLIWQPTDDSDLLRFERLLGLGLFTAFALIVTSALIDRIQTRKTDHYRKVQK